VRYYLAFSQTAVDAARQNADLQEIDSAGVWHMFLVADSELVQPLRYSPVVYDNVGDHQAEWLQPAAKFFDDPTQYDVLRADRGPADWPRYSLPAVQVSNVEAKTESLDFDVDQVGVPVLVKMSYFPNWKVDGAEGPYRVTPNLMVVIPTSTHVSLHYGYTGVDYLAYAMTALGLVLVALLFRRGPPALLPVHGPALPPPPDPGWSTAIGMPLSPPAAPASGLPPPPPPASGLPPPPPASGTPSPGP
jgi:hypothetical protein